MARRRGAVDGTGTTARAARAGVVALGVALVVLLSATPALAWETGPPLRVDPARLDASLVCRGDLRGAKAEPALLVPGTTLTAAINFDWNYERAFDATGRPWCAVTLPNDAMSDIAVSAEYVVHALRTMHERAGRTVDVVGFSQGGMIPRWALKYWPDTRETVDDVVGIDPSNHGTLSAYAVCPPVAGCAPAFWQQRTGSSFLRALNRGPETFAGIDYTQMYTLTDEVVFPNLPPAPSSSLSTGAGARTNVAVQAVCPAHVADHLTMGSIDAVAYALVVDALDHTGPARPSRVDRAVCAAPLMPGVDPATLAAQEARYNGHVAAVVATYPHVPAEPPLPAYATGS